MLHRFLLCIMFLSLVASAQPDERANENANVESWSFGYGSDEGGSASSYLGVDIADVTAERISALSSKRSMAPRSRWSMRTLPPAKPDSMSTT